MKHSFFLAILFFQAAFSQIVVPETTQAPFKWIVTTSCDSCCVNEAFTIRLRLSAGGESYISKSSISVYMTSGSGIISGNPEFTQVQNHFNKLTKTNDQVLINGMTIAVPCTVSQCSSDILKTKILCSYQGCVKNMCFLPATDSLSVILHIRNNKHSIDVLPAKASVSKVSNKRDKMDAFSKGSVIALLLAFLGGLLTCLTPCVYPLIPITISIFGASSAKSRLGAFGLSCIYIAGISVMFSFLGFLFAATGRVFGQFMSNPWIIGFIAIVFCAFGVSLMGAFNMQLPSALQNKLSGFTGKSSGRTKVFFMGLVAGIIAAPCTGPSLGAILTYIAASGGRWTGIIMLFSFSLGLGFPFLLLGTFSGLIASRPKPGPWMDWVKSILGIAMFVTALYFLRNIIPSLNMLIASTPTQYIASAILTAAGFFIGAVHLSCHGESLVCIFRKSVGCVLVTAGVFGLWGQVLVKAPEQSNMAQTGLNKTDDGWMNDVYGGIDSARVSHKPVIIDFYADWCASCKELDLKTFSDSSVKKELSRFVRIRADFTKETSAAKKLAGEYSIRGLPVMEFYSSDGKILEEKRLTGFVRADALLEHLKAIK